MHKREVAKKEKSERVVNGFEPFRDPSIPKINRTEKANGRTRKEAREQHCVADPQETTRSSGCSAGRTADF